MSIRSTAVKLRAAQGFEGLPWTDSPQLLVANVPQDTPALVFNHVALSCVTIDAPVPWWTDILNFEIMSPIRQFSREAHPDMFKYTFYSYPEAMREVKFAVLMAGNGVDIEIF
jgi:hypothetical protein